MQLEAGCVLAGRLLELPPELALPDQVAVAQVPESGRVVLEVDLRSRPAGRNLGVAVELSEHIERPRREGPIGITATVEIHAADRTAIAEITQLQADAAALPVDIALGPDLSPFPRAPGTGIVGFRPAARRWVIRNLRYVLIAPFIAPSNPAGERREIIRRDHRAAASRRSAARHASLRPRSSHPAAIAPSASASSKRARRRNSYRVRMTRTGRSGGSASTWPKLDGRVLRKFIIGMSFMPTRWKSERRSGIVPVPPPFRYLRRRSQPGPADCV